MKKKMLVFLIIVVLCILIFLSLFFFSYLKENSIIKKEKVPFENDKSSLDDNNQIENPDSDLKINDSNENKDTSKSSDSISSNGETSPDGKFTVEKVACLGCCSLAPCIMLNGEVHGRLSSEAVGKIVNQVEKTKIPTPA